MSDAKRRTRPKPRDSSKAQEIVREIIEMMSDGIWAPGPSRKLLAQKHGLAVSTIAGYVTRAADAMRGAHASNQALAEEVMLTSVPRLARLSLKEERGTPGNPALGIPASPPNNYRAAQIVRITNEVVGNITKGTTVNLTTNMLVDASGAIRAEAKPAIEQLMAPTLEAIAKVVGTECGCRRKIGDALREMSGATVKQPEILDATPE